MENWKAKWPKVIASMQELHIEFDKFDLENAREMQDWRRKFLGNIFVDSDTALGY